MRGGLEFLPLGSGLGTFADVFRRYQDEGITGFIDHAHNDYLEFWVEYGPAGLAAFLAISLWVARARLAAPQWGVLACLAVTALVDFPFHRPAEWALYWMMLGCVAPADTDKGQLDPWQI